MPSIRPTKWRHKVDAPTFLLTTPLMLDRYRLTLSTLLSFSSPLTFTLLGFKKRASIVLSSLFFFHNSFHPFLTYCIFFPLNEFFQNLANLLALTNFSWIITLFDLTFTSFLFFLYCLHHFCMPINTFHHFRMNIITHMAIQIQIKF